MSSVEFQNLSPQRTIIDGELEFHHVEAGDGPPLILLHGVLGDWRSWELHWEFFVEHFRTIAYSRRFNWPNRNPLNSPHHSAEIEANDLAALIHKWETRPAILVGSSYGAYTALALAAKQPELVRAMALLEPPMLSWADLTASGKKIRADFECNIRRPGFEAFQQGKNEEAVRLLTGGIVGQSVLNSLPEELMLRRQQNMQSIRMLTLSTDEFPFIPEDTISGITVPTLLMTGDKTPAIHDCVFKSLCKAMPQAKQVRIPNAGHAAERDNPDFYRKSLSEFFIQHDLL